MVSCFGIWACGLAGFIVPQSPPPPPPPPVVITRPAPTTTTTTTTMTTVPPAVLTFFERAQAAVGRSRTSYGFTNFWCAEWVEYVLDDPRYDTALDSPAHLQLIVPSVSDPQPGDLVFINIMPEYSPPDQTSHVAIVKSVTVDGVKVIESNGSDATTEMVGRGFWPFSQVTGYGRA